MGWQGDAKLLCATEWPSPNVNSTQSPCAAVTVSGVNVRPGPTLTLCTPEADDDEPEAVAVMLELSVEDADEPESPYCGVARTEAASAERRRVVDVSIDCIFFWLEVWSSGRGRFSSVARKDIKEKRWW